MRWLGRKATDERDATSRAERGRRGKWRRGVRFRRRLCGPAFVLKEEPTRPGRMASSRGEPVSLATPADTHAEDRKVRMKQLCIALLGLAVAGGPLGAQVVSVQQKAAPAVAHEEQHIALTQQYRMMMTFARRVEMAQPGEEEDARANAEKLVNAVENAAASLDALAKVTDSTQVGQIEAIRKLQATAKGHADELKAEIAKTPMELKLAKQHAIEVREVAEQAEELHGKMLPNTAPAKPDVPKP